VAREEEGTEGNTWAEARRPDMEKRDLALGMIWAVGRRQ
jgi:hypothetical protein